MGVDSPASDYIFDIAIGTLAIGTSLGITAAPAHAVALNNGALGFTGGTSDFFANTNTSSFSVNFSNNNPPTTAVNSATGDFATSGFATTGIYSLNSPMANFTQVGSTNNGSPPLMVISKAYHHKWRRAVIINNQSLLIMTWEIPDFNN